MLEAVSVFPAEVGVEAGWSDLFLVDGRGLRARWWRVVVLGPDQAPRGSWVRGEAVQFPFRGSAGVFGGEASVVAEEVFKGLVRSAFEG